MVSISQRSSCGPSKIHLFGFDFDALTQDGLLERITQTIQLRTTCWIATVNVSHLCLVARQPELGAVLRSADVITADGMPIVWMSKLRGRALQQRVTGSDLVYPLARLAAARGWRLFLCGGEEGIAERAAEQLCAHAPGLTIVGTAAPQFPTVASIRDADLNRPVLDAISRARADILLVAFGAPKQERWILHQLRTGALDVRVVMGVGASLDFAAGRQRRAPPWMRRTGVEWIHRLLTQPRRLGPRYARDLLTFAQLATHELLGRERRGGKLP